MHAPTPDAPIEIETARNPRAAVIWLHGLGADGNDFVPIVPELRLPRTLAVRFVFPHAPHRPVTVNGGYVMRAWYDMGVVERDFHQEPAHIDESVATVHALVRRETQRGIDTRRIVLAGFSQGGVIALHAGLLLPEPLAGLLVMSAPMPYVDALLARATPASADVPLFLAHGVHDPMAPYALAEQTWKALRANGRRVEWHSYPIEHTVSLEEIGAIGRWLVKVLS